MSGKTHIVRPGHYVRSHRRHVIQHSRYTMCMDWKSGLPFRSHDEGLTIEGALGLRGEAVKITIPCTQRRAALIALDLMNINAYTLFGSDDNLIRTIARRECLLRDF